MEKAILILFVAFIGSTFKVKAKLPDDTTVLCEQDPTMKTSLRSLTRLEEIIEQIPQFLPAGNPLANEIAVYGKDDRFFETLPFMGKVNNRCSGFLISECHVLTANHCSLEIKTNELDNRRSDLQYKPDGSEISYSAEIIQVPKFSGLSYASGKEDTYYNNDFLIAKLSGSPGKDGNYMGLYKMPVGAFGLKLPSICKNGKIRASGYSSDKDWQQISTDPTGVIIKHRRGQLYMREDTYKGSSGGPIYCIDKLGKPYAIGINSTAFTDSTTKGPAQLKDSEKKYLATAMSSSVFFDWVVEFQKNIRVIKNDI